ncbi:DUF427 domain-containing protein [Vreelandella titanicae]|uniref:DUF427 domain-containing protein n=1 Tax=Vreelandella titanicae TaxID=664683 RepID=A0A558J834_9GAMM|nr:DUF427 domain-containing protein [Halomonas titanicae]TVU89672.1 DUF427 domain-containing protein [Halomonas titanicae]
MSQAPRITLHHVNQRVQVYVDGKLLADSNQALEHRYPARQYFPREDVRMNLLTLSETTTPCHRFDLFIASSSRGLESPGIPGRFRSLVAFNSF